MFLIIHVYVYILHIIIKMTYSLKDRKIQHSDNFHWRERKHLDMTSRQMLFIYLSHCLIIHLSSRQELDQRK
jgi:hypothetical protein